MNGDVRKFGIIALIFFGILCALGIWRNRTIPIYLFGSLSILGIAFVVFPDRMRPIYRRWLRVTHLIGRFVTAVILTVAYYLVMTPSALLKR